MNRTGMHNRIVLALAGITLALLAANRATAAEKVIFHVHGGSCSRSTQLLATCDNMWDATRAAEEARKKFRQVVVTTGADEHYLLGQTPSVYLVYRNPCKFWSVDAKTENLDRARELVKVIEKNGERGEIVHHFVAKK